MNSGSGITLKSGGKTFRLSPAAAAEIRIRVRAKKGAEGRGVLFGTVGRTVEIRAVRRFESDPEANSPIEETARFCRLLDAPRVEDVDGVLRPVGWYVSRDPDSVELTSEDIEFHRALFGEDDLVLLCERLSGGEIRFVPRKVSQEKAGSTASWTWPVGVAALFALLCITAAAGFRRDSEVARPVAAPAESQASVRCSGDEAVKDKRPADTLRADIQQADRQQADKQQVDKLERDLSFQVARNQRLEAALQLLREKPVHPRDVSAVAVNGGVQ